MFAVVLVVHHQRVSPGPPQSALLEHCSLALQHLVQYMVLSLPSWPCWQVAADAAGGVRRQARHQRRAGLRQLPCELLVCMVASQHTAAVQICSLALVECCRT